MSVLSKPDKRGFSLVEVVVAMGLSAVVIGGCVYGYTLSARRAEWSSYSLAANSLAVQSMEQARAAKWDPMAFPAIDELVATNFPTRIDVLDLPISGTNVTYGTSVVTIATISVAPPLKQIRVDTSWSFVGKGAFTNTIVTCRAPDQ
jgi:prepilin-type N-terminal cleavage/methylation domain-containing protein